MYLYHDHACEPVSEKIGWDCHASVAKPVLVVTHDR